MKELMIGGGERDRAQGHVEHVAIQLEVGRFAQMVGREIGEQAFGVFAHAGQRPAQFGQGGVALGVRQCDAPDPRNGQLGRNLSPQQHELGMQPALGVDKMEQDLADAPLIVAKALAEPFLVTRVEQRPQLTEVLLQRGPDVYKISDDVYLNRYPT